MDKYRLCGGTLITENGEKSKDLLISDGKIEAIISREINSSESYFPIDCGGKYVSPGFVDIHQHGGGGSDYMELALSALCSAPTGDSLSDAAFNFEEVFLREQPVCGLVFRSEYLMTSQNVLGKLMPTINAPYRNIYRWS